MTKATTYTRKRSLKINIRVMAIILRFILLAKCAATGLVWARTIELPVQNLTLLSTELQLVWKFFNISGNKRSKFSFARTLSVH